MSLTERKNYGWKRDLPDHRDFLFEAKPGITLPVSVDLRDKMPPVYDQGQLGSCTANAIGGNIEYIQGIQGETEFTPSRLFIYYNERVIEGSVNYDAGAEIRDGIKTVANQGAAPETDWPYVISKFAQKPPANAYSDALRLKALTYYSITGSGSSRATKIKTALAQGLPVVFGFSVYESFEGNQTAQTGIVTYPTRNEQLLGGHAVILVGYKKIGRSSYFIARNSWGPDWGDQGYFYMPYKYIESASLCSDFWVIQTES